MFVIVVAVNLFVQIIELQKFIKLNRANHSSCRNANINIGNNFLEVNIFNEVAHKSHATPFTSQGTFSHAYNVAVAVNDGRIKIDNPAPHLLYPYPLEHIEAEFAQLIGTLKIFETIRQQLLCDIDLATGHEPGRK